MATILRIDSFHESNIVERSELSLDYVPESTTLLLRSTQGLVDGQPIYVGHLSLEGCEKAVIDAMVDEMTISLSEALKLPHARYEPVTAVLGDSIHIYRAPNVDGTVPADDQFTVLTTRTIDPDQMSTYYRDSTGSSAFWYRYTYFNPITLEETAPSDAFRGDDFAHYASLSEIRNEAGFQNATNLADSVIEQKRRDAEAEINASLSGAYTVPFTQVPEIIRTLTIQLASAFLLDSAYGNASSRQKLKDARAAIDTYRLGASILTDDAGTALSTSESITGYPGTPDDDAPRFFHMGDKF
jgi:phage gp36-like protein